MSTLGDWIRELADVTHSQFDIEAKAYQADRQADLLDRERGHTAALHRSNLDLIKRLKEANDKLERVRERAAEWSRVGESLASGGARDVAEPFRSHARQLHNILEG